MAIEYLKRGISDQKRSEDDANTAKIVSQTLLDIEERGDQAVRELAVKFDGFDRDNYKLSQTEIQQIISKVSDDDMRDLKFAQEQVRNFAEAQRESMQDIEVETMPGVIWGIKISRCSLWAVMFQAVSFQWLLRPTCQWRLRQLPAFRV